PQFVSYKREAIYDTRMDSEGEEETYIKEYQLTDIPETVNYRRLIVPILKEAQLLRVEIDAFKTEQIINVDSFPNPAMSGKIIRLLTNNKLYLGVA
ncbi:unnamed protein product, partial [marine sediment metagenome]